MCVSRQGAIGRVTLARIEGALLAIDGDENDEIVELTAVEIARLEEVPVAIDDSHPLRVESGGAGQREKEHGKFVWGAALEGQDIGGRFDALNALGTVLFIRVLAGVARVLQLHHRLVELGELLVLGGRSRGQLFRGIIDGGRGRGEFIDVVRPGLAI